MPLERVPIVLLLQIIQTNGRSIIELQEVLA